MKYNYSDSELKTLLQSITILIDSREQKNNHIKEYFDKKNISYQIKKLDYGDYSCMLPAKSELGIVRNIYLSQDIAIERKASLEELSGNFTADRGRFESELLRANKTKLLLMVENPNGYTDIIGHKYQTRYEPKSFIATLMAYQARYNLDVNFIPANLAGFFIAQTLYYHCREYLKAGVS